MKYIVGFSGGIDSTFVAWYLKKLGHEVLLVNLKNTYEPNKCCSVPTQLFKIADFLNLPLEIVNATDEFKKFVIDEFVNSYLSGKTPNPCINCNENVRFKILNEIRKQKNYDFIVTGHYIKKYEDGDFITFSIGKDSWKDQTYMLYRLIKFPEIMKTVEFPLGDFNKSEIKQIILENKIPVNTNKESQNICFVPDDDYPRFIRQNYNAIISPGKIVDKYGNYLGEHKGLIYYTIGQRKGLNISSNQKLYVIKLDWQTNTLVVGTNEDLLTNEVNLVENLVLHYKFRKIAELKDYGFDAIYGKIRYKAKLEKVVDINEKKVIFENKIRAVTPGQHLVLYGKKADKFVVIGGGIIL